MDGLCIFVYCPLFCPVDQSIPLTFIAIFVLFPAIFLFLSMFASSYLARLHLKMGFILEDYVYTY